MVSFDANPLDGPRVSTSDPAGSAKRAMMYVIGAGIFFALLTTAQATVTPAVQSGLGRLPYVQTGNNDSQLQLGA